MKLLAVFALLLPFHAPAQTAPSPNLAGVAHIALRVHSLADSVTFYQKLGFVKAFELSRDGKVYEAFIKINDRQFIELYPADEKNPQLGFLHVCFAGDDLHSVHDFYVAQGLSPKDVRTAGAGNLLFTMPGPATPTGPQNLEYTQYMPGSLHSRDFGKNLGAGRIADRFTSVAIATEDPDAAHAFYLDKLHFLPVGGSATLLAIPGSSNESIDIAPPSLGFKARFALQTGDLKAALKLLHKASIPVRPSAHTLTLTDPDENIVLVEDTSVNPTPGH